MWILTIGILWGLRQFLFEITTELDYTNPFSPTTRTR